MCEQCLPELQDLTTELMAQNTELRRLFPDPEPLVDPGDDEPLPGTDLRVQVCDGGWMVHTGSAQYDVDHRGIWACSWLPWAVLTSDEAQELAEELLEELLEDLAQTDTGECP